MDLPMTPEPTHTRYEPDASEPISTLRHDENKRHFPPRAAVLREGEVIDISLPESPPEDLLLRVVMTFTDALVHLDVLDADVSVEGKTVWEAFGRLVAAVREHVLSAEGEEANLLRYAPHTWFKFVPPDQVRSRQLEADFWPEGEDVEAFIAAATEGRYEEEEDEPDS